VEVGVATAVDAFFRDAKSRGVFDALKACCILAGARTLAGALVPVVGDAPTNVANGFVSGDYTRGGATPGLKGDGTSYLDSGRANDDDPQNDWHLGLYYSAVNPNTGKIDAGAGSSALGALNFAQAAGTLFVRSKSTSASESVGTTGTGFAGLSRSLSTAYDYRVNASTGSASTTSRTPTTDNVFIFARNDGAGNGAFPTDATFAFYSIGTSLSLEDLDTAVTNLINRLKFALLVGENPSGLDPDTIDYIVRGYEAGGTLE
jgi:hypothetical protein